MTTEQVVSRLEEIKRLLFEREKYSKLLHEIDAQIAELAGIHQDSKKVVKRTSSKDFASAFGRT